MTDYHDVGMDVETTGLNPWESKAVTVAFAVEDQSAKEVTSDIVFDDPDDEHSLLCDVEAYMRNTRIDLLVGWNHTEFDLPYLAVRFVLNGIDLAPHLIPSGRIGKYGKPLYNGAWYGAAFRDVAYHYQAEAEQAGVKWSLKPFAEYKGLGKGMEVDFNQTKRAKSQVPCEHPKDFGGNEHEFDIAYEEEPFTILDLDRADRMSYCISDARLALGLHQLEPAVVVKGQAVMFDGKTTFL